MSDSERDEQFDDFVRRVIVPRGFRPKTDEEVEAMLDGLKGEKLAKEKLERMLAKARGEMPMSWEVTEEAIEQSPMESSEAKELAAMFREEGEELTPEQEEKLKEFEDRASQPPAEDDDPDGC